MSELTNQEFRDLKGSLSNRGCYFKDERGTIVAVEELKDATHFVCLDCAAKLPIRGVRNVVEGLGEKTIIRPICAKCFTSRKVREIEEGN